MIRRNGWTLWLVTLILVVIVTTLIAIHVSGQSSSPNRVCYHKYIVLVDKYGRQTTTEVDLLVSCP